MKNGSDSRFEVILKAMAGVPVLVAGDIMLDRFTYGRVERISPESPVPVLTITREDLMLGGAGNALANIVGLGAKGYALGLLGDDGHGRMVKDKAEDLGINTAGLLIDKTRPTTVKTRFLAGHQQLLRTDFERAETIDDQTARQILKQAEKIIPLVKAVILSDYGKGLLRADVVAGIITRARKLDIPVIVDPKTRDYALYKGANVVTPNRKELAEATGMSTKTDAEVIAAAEKIIRECGIDAVVATRAQDGLSVIQKNYAPAHFRAAEIEVFDVSGAGDTVIATIAAALACGADLAEAGALANIAGGIVVTKIGTAPIRAKELQEAAQGHSAPLADWQEAAEQVKRWRAKGLKIGFTNGCFDILHAGHVGYLADARKQCDRLIVGLNNDVSVKILKGAERPVHDESSRAAVLSALSAVDLVVLFGAAKKGEDNTATRLIELLKPDIYFKGGDYTESQIPEAPAVKSYGGIVSIVPATAGQSTTNSLKKIRAAG